MSHQSLSLKQVLNLLNKYIIDSMLMTNGVIFFFFKGGYFCECNNAQLFW